MNKLLKEAIADAKAVRETALANAKLALEEAFTPRLQSMLSAKLSEEEGEDEYAPEVAEDTYTAGVDDQDPAMEEVYEDEMEEEETMETEPAPEMEEGEEEVAPEPVPEPEMEEGEGEDDLELEAIIRELEGEIEGSDEIEEGEEEVAPEPEPEAEVAVEETVTEEEGSEDDVSIEEIIKALREEDEEEITEGEDEEEVTEAAEEDLEEAYTVIKFLKSKINEVNLLNAKLLFSNKLFRNFAMNESQKMKVIENFDRASTIREVKLVFSTLAESLKVNKTKRIVKESTASRPTRSTAPRRVISEGTALASRWAKLAGLNK